MAEITLDALEFILEESHFAAAVATAAQNGTAASGLLPILLQRNVTVVGAAGLPDMPLLRFLAPRVVKLGHRVRLTFRRVAAYSPHKDSLSRAPHVPMLDMSDPGSGASVVLDTVLLFLESCNPLESRQANLDQVSAALTRAQAAGQLPSGPALEVDLNINQTAAGCVNESLARPTAPLLQRCWPVPIVAMGLPPPPAPAAADGRGGGSRDGGGGTTTNTTGIIVGCVVGGSVALLAVLLALWALKLRRRRDEQRRKGQHGQQQMPAAPAGDYLGIIVGEVAAVGTAADKRMGATGADADADAAFAAVSPETASRCSNGNSISECCTKQLLRANPSGDVYSRDEQHQQQHDDPPPDLLLASSPFRLDFSVNVVPVAAIAPAAPAAPAIAAAAPAAAAKDVRTAPGEAPPPQQQQQQPQQQQLLPGAQQHQQPQPPAGRNGELLTHDEPSATDVLELLPVVRGKGAFGRVVEGIYRGERVAVKMLLVPGDGDVSRNYAAVLGAFRQEVEVLGRCSHPNVVKLLAACLDPRQPCLVMELCETSLEALIFKRDPQQQQGAPQLLPLVTVLGIAIDICNAISYLHPTVIHRDLKPANVLINGASSGAPVAKITDFGLARFRAMTMPTQSPEAGTVAFMAPECFDVGQSIITHHADLYSLGVLLWMLLTGQQPWAGLPPMAVAYMVCAQGARLSLAGLCEERCPRKLRRVLVDLWDADPLRRPAAPEVAKELMLLRDQLLRGAGGRAGAATADAAAAEEGALALQEGALQC
ncbi:hypothetical protein HYH02_011053 [Chlamydomonas schloesseri]|uniref:Protein kinase domain-containing protein n=1 Tax=Chlamydomonas schloesseri TaxID=2026947 RepID=A0A835T7H0_9CHLO|nr:hypothetical protein HYH02_011053 [Chlamydomonas schloesseri]|eukprot:KAG2437673.1 hypothetical protein HYH02_011053 [Chlamydomonas schloesseri]